MNKQAAVSLAGAVFLVVATATVALGLNIGLLTNASGETATTTAPAASVARVTETTTGDTAPPPTAALDLFPEDMLAEVTSGSDGTLVPVEPRAINAAAAATYPTFDIDGIGDVTVAHSTDEIRFQRATTIDDWTYIVDHEGPDRVEVRFERVVDGLVVERASFSARPSTGHVLAEIESPS